MAQSYFIFSDTKVEIEKFHICSWEFGHEKAILEIGCEIKRNFPDDVTVLTLEFYIPWLDPNLQPIDLYSNLKEPSNSKFIFNDSVSTTQYLDDGSTVHGVIHSFSDRTSLAILPVFFDEINKGDKILKVKIDLEIFRQKKIETDSIYIRFYFEPNASSLSTRKPGLARTKIIYDVKLNELRNLPPEFHKKALCSVASLFYFNIIPNNYDITAYDSETMQNVRNLEFESFRKYLPNAPIKDEELLVVFNKRLSKEKFKFFIIFTKERIGTGQFVLATLINLICGLILSYRSFNTGKTSFWKIRLPYTPQFWIVVSIIFLSMAYFFGAYLLSLPMIRFKKKVN